MKIRIRISNIKCIGKSFVLFILFPFGCIITHACTVDQKVSQNSSVSQIRPWRGNAEAHYQLACYYQDRNRHREALEEFQKMIVINPADIRAYNGIGICCDALKDFPRAFLAYEKALKLNPQAGYVYNNLGYSYFLQKRYNEAVLSFKKAVEQSGDTVMQKKISSNLNMALALSEKPQLAATAKQTDLPAKPQVTTVARATSFNEDRHIRNLMIQRNPLALHSPSPARTPDVAANSISVPKGNISIEVANGNGVRYMARNVGEYLKKRGYNVVRLTNANSYSYQKGNVSYRTDGQTTAQEIAAMFPRDVDVKKLKDGTRKDVRVRVLVGKDLIPYKKVFMEDRG